MKQIFTILSVVLSLSLFFSCSDNNDDAIDNNPKEIVITGNAEVLSSTSAILNGYANGRDGAIGFCYSATEKNPSLDNATSVKATSIMSDNSYSVTVTGLSASTTYYYRAYATKDGLAVLAKDVKTFQTEKKKFWSEAVDLGLPSGLQWATCNLGANTPEEYGDYFAWGETEPKTTYEWNYKWCRGSSSSMTKYCTERSCGTVDNKTVLDLEDDAAHVNWGGAWRMPTRDEQDELRNKCSWTWTTQNGVDGYKVKGPNGNSIFLPAAGYRLIGGLYSAGSYGYYWSSSLSASYSDNAYYLGFDSGYQNTDNGYRFYGQSVRPVCQ